MSDATTPKTPAAAPKIDRDRDRNDTRARIAAHCMPLRLQQAHGTSTEQKRIFAAAESVKDADELLKALGI